MAPKSTSKRYKIKSNFKSGKIRLEDRLKTVLGRSWPHLKVEFGHFLVEIVEPVKNPGFRQNLVSRPFWTQLGPIWAAKRSQKGSQKGPKRHQKRDQNNIKFLIDFGSFGGAMLRSFWRLLAAKLGQVGSKTRLESLSSSKT